ncbi:MAG: nucleoside 2-deoxyribosyltransferase [Bacteroidales bacterium]|nr:nucleoside 2-deoxyribosyltransferase [Bacteroidales bacterium]
MKTCFVIQQFDVVNNQRYQSVIKPAIEEAGFAPYRVDQDKTVQIPIESIEQRIKESTVCFADISDDNANVWFEVGFAVALEKPLILVCADTKDISFYPYDIRHRKIISYTAGTTPGHKKLKQEITDCLKAMTE